MKTKKTLLMLLAVTLFITSCSKDEDNPTPTPTPASMRISKIIVKSFNQTGPDDLSNPDIYVTVSTGSDCNGSILYESPSYFTDASSGGNQEFIPSSPIVISDPTTPYSICLYDFDDLDPNDDMGGVTFTPFVSANGAPATRIITAGSISYEVYLQYFY